MDYISDYIGDPNLKDYLYPLTTYEVNIIREVFNHKNKWCVFETLEFNLPIGSLNANDVSSIKKLISVFRDDLYNLTTERYLIFNSNFKQLQETTIQSLHQILSID